jgi:hypothetical protein
MHKDQASVVMKLIILLWTIQTLMLTYFVLSQNSLINYEDLDLSNLNHIIFVIAFFGDMILFIGIMLFSIFLLFTKENYNPLALTFNAVGSVFFIIGSIAWRTYTKLLPELDIFLRIQIFVIGYNPDEITGWDALGAFLDVLYTGFLVSNFGILLVTIGFGLLIAKGSVKYLLIFKGILNLLAIMTLFLIPLKMFTSSILLVIVLIISLSTPNDTYMK